MTDRETMSRQGVHEAEPARIAAGLRPPAPWRAFRDEWVIDEDAAWLVVSKPEGVPTQRGAQPDDLSSRVGHYLAQRGDGAVPAAPYLAAHQHLERDVSGLTVLARSKEANPGLARQFESRQVQLGMVAWVRGDARRLPRQFQVPLPEGRRGRHGRPGQALGHVRVEGVDLLGDVSRIMVAARGLRPRDLRAALAAQGLPLLGESLGEAAGERRLDAPRLMLHVAWMELQHPLEARLCRFERAPCALFEMGPQALQAGWGSPKEAQAQLSLALERRYGLALDPGTNAFRIINAAGDGLPQVSADLYDRWVVVHAHGDQAIEPLLDRLDRLGFEGIYLKRPPRQANVLVDPTREALAPSRPLRGRAAPAMLEVRERDLNYSVQLGEGLRTGLFLDQRDNRQRVRELAQGRRVLNLFAYTSSFSLAALAGGAREVVSIDASRVALEQGERMLQRADLLQRHRAVTEDVFAAIERLGQARERFDLVIVDPPTYSVVRGRRFRAPKDYPALIHQVLRLIDPGGWVLASINHRGTDLGRFRRLLTQGLTAARRQGRIRPARVPVDLPQAGPDDFGTKSLWIHV